MCALRSSAQLGCWGRHQAQRGAGAAPCGLRGTFMLQLKNKGYFHTLDKEYCFREFTNPTSRKNWALCQVWICMGS